MANLDFTTLLNQVSKGRFLVRAGFLQLGRVARKIDSLIAGGELKLGSPVEYLLLAALLMESEIVGPVSINPTASADRSINCVGIFPQYHIGDYRVDFLVAVVDLIEKNCVVVECDGHDFHEKTKSQVARDKKRDRAITADGYAILRFSGSEVWADAGKCAQEVMRVVCHRAMGESSDEGGEDV